MARLFPRHARKKATRGEKQVLSQLERLDDSWYVLHSLEFGGAKLGEIDFVLLHRRHGMLVLEVKDGRYRVEQGRWIGEQRNGNEIELRTSPFTQAKDHRFDVIKWLKAHTAITYVPAAHCVLFTDGRPTGQLGPAAPEAIVLTGASLADPGPAIVSVIAAQSRRSWESDADFVAAVAALAPEERIAPTLDFNVDISADRLEQLTALQIEWTAEQLKVLSATSASRGARRLVLGAAGTGKTIIAQEHAWRLSGGDVKVALLGQHRHLRLQLRRRRPTGVACGDLRDVLADLYGPAELDSYEGQPTWLAAIGLAEKYGPRLDHLIVDEAQSYDDYHLQAMPDLVRPSGSILLLADPYQRDNKGTWTPTGNYDKLPLGKNCRNVFPIARLVARLAGSPTPSSGAKGMRPLFTESKDVEIDGLAVVRRLLADLSPGRIVVLTETVARQRAMRTAMLRAGVQAHIATSLGEDGLLVSTVDNFRGCEAEAIVYLAERPEPADRTSDYIAVSRACSYLHVVGQRQRWESVLYLMGDTP